MDLLGSFRTQSAIAAANTVDERPVVYVAPLPRQGVPADGALQYSTVSTLADAVGGTVADGHCFLFSEEAGPLSVLRILNDYPNVLPFRVKRLEGLTGVEYPAGFMRDSWALDGEPYFNRVVAAAERKQAEVVVKKEAAAKSKVVREQQARTRLSGHTRRHEAFDVVQPEATADSDADVGAAED